MLTLQKTKEAAIVSVATGDRSIEDLLGKEWLLTNSRGGYASSTIVGCNTRRYHGLLIGSLHPPVNRIMALAGCLEMVVLKGQRFNLSTFEFKDRFAPAGFGHIKRFRRDVGVHFDYQLNSLGLTKSVYLLRDSDTVALVYDFAGVAEPVEFILRPFVGLRDFHALQKSYTPLCSRLIDDGLLIRHDTTKGSRLAVSSRMWSAESCELFLSCPAADFEKDEQWWFNFVYRKDRERGQDFTEDLWTPGFFKCRIEAPARIIFWANLSSKKEKRLTAENAENNQLSIEAVRKDLHKHQNIVIAAAKAKDERLKKLCLAAEQFIVTRAPGAPATILAGFPWFADWGRDVFIALPGLLLSTGRFDEARSVLTSFAAAADGGMIPNRFDDNGDTAYFNSIDASLWFINAAFQYLEVAGDSKTFTQQLLPTIRWIIDSYHNGTRFGIRADTDGLITAGTEETQLTWMDAKYDGVAFTPRCGKAVEVNALWYNGLCLIAQFYADRSLPKRNTSRLGVQRNIENAGRYKSMADRVAGGFRQFWNEAAGYLNDCILPDGSADASLRPNQIFAVSLPFSPLPPHQQKSVVDAVQKELLTPYGLRTLNSRDSCYEGTYTGPQQQRDEAYHQGTVWPYLIGPFVAGYLKVQGFSRKSKRKAAEFIEPLMQHLTEDGCLGQVCEIFDGDAPHKPRGCIAQAWSVGELIRAYQLINS